MSLENIRLGIFDHSGVISDDRQPVYEANMVLMSKYGLHRISFDEWLALTKASAGELMHSFGVEVSGDDINKEYARAYTEIVTRDDNSIKPEMYGGVPDVLRGLRNKGLKLAIVSNHPKQNLVEELGRYDILDLFDEVFGDPTPKAERLKMVCDMFHVPIWESFFVEDTIYGLRSGSGVGVGCFGVTTGYHSRKRLEAEGTAIAVIDSLDELFNYVS